MINYIYANLLKIAIVRLSHPRRGNIQSQETFLVLFAEKQTNVNLTTKHLKLRYISIFENLIIAEDATRSVKTIYKYIMCQIYWGFTAENLDLK